MAEERASTSRRLRIARRRLRIFDRAVWRKSSRYTLSGLVISGVGAVLIFFGLLSNTGAYSTTGLLIGFGVIIVVVGIIRLLIGFINPSTPEDLPPPEEHEKPLDQVLFERPQPEDDSV